MAVIECIDLSKSYSRHVTALKNINLSIEAGTAFGLLGENGAGKSTLVRILMGFIHPSSGRVRVFAEERVERAHSRIGYVHERPFFEMRFSGRAYLTYLAKLSGLWDHTNHVRVEGLLERVNLQEVADRAVGTYSKGMLQRLTIAQALLSDPDLLILDEPTSGLDPRSQWEIRQIIMALCNQGKTILLCSHNLAEVEVLCDAVGILRRGELILCGAVADLLHSQDIVEIALAEELSARDVVSRLGIAVIEVQANLLCIAASSQAAALSALVQAQIPILALNPVSRTLEEVYVRATLVSQDASLVAAG
ncbi:MAG TPA: ABC transporter ATP-binding protein [Ktedonobacteraceae bacterium]|nr:ABC transporter ATP-binding protein [Ktedonobacteraceae bacterium]